MSNPNILIVDGEAFYLDSSGIEIDSGRKVVNLYQGEGSKTLVKALSPRVEGQSHGQVTLNGKSMNGYLLISHPQGGPHEG